MTSKFKLQRMKGRLNEQVLELLIDDDFYLSDGCSQVTKSAVKVPLTLGNDELHPQHLNALYEQ